MPIDQVDVVLGTDYGDEGKGKVVYDLIKQNHYNLCIRFNGGSNAGHTIYDENDNKIVLHQLPIGIVVNDVYTLISSDCVIDIDKLKMEIAYIKSIGINVYGRILISKTCHIITNDCIEDDKKNNIIGTTNSGIGTTYSKKMLRTGIRIENCDISKLFDDNVTLVDMRTFWYSDFIKQNNIKKVLMEGAQGFNLDINWCLNYPYCTSSTCTLSGAINTGFPLKSLKNVYGVSKIYSTYVGTMDFHKNLKNSSDYNKMIYDFKQITDLGKEYGATTGRQRQVNYLNIDNLINALRCNNCNICIINKVDILDQLKIYRLYHNNNLISFNNLNDMKTYIIKQLKFVKVIFSYNKYKI